MQSRRSSRQQLVNGAQVLIRELLREPIKEAVREGIREELADRESDELRIEADSSADKGGSRLSGLAMKGVAVALVVGIAYYMRSKQGGMMGSESETGSVDRAGRDTEFGSDIGESGESGFETAGGETAE